MKSKSQRLHNELCEIMPGGVNETLHSLEPPIFFNKAKGSKIFDVDGNQYVDYHLGFGSIILGHGNPRVADAAAKQFKTLDLVGAGAYELEYELAKKLTQHIPSARMVRFCNAGSDATFNAIRLARGFTGKKMIMKFEGGYHGWHDYVLMNVAPPRGKTGSPYPQSEGMLQEAIENTIIAPFNDIEAVQEILKERRDEIAAVITEPIQHINGCIMPQRGFLKSLREMTEENDVILIFDEVVTAFRHDLGGAQRIFEVTPDLTCVGKPMANGFPIAAVCGREDIMSHLAPLGNVVMSGTYYAYPVSVAAAYATIEQLESGGVHAHIERLGDHIRKGLSKIISDLNLKAQVVGFKSIFWVYFTDADIVNYESLLTNDSEMFLKFAAGMRQKGIFFLPRSLKRCHISAAHTMSDAERFLTSAREVLSNVRHTGHPKQEA